MNLAGPEKANFFMISKNRIKYMIGWAITVAFVALALESVDFQDLISALQGRNFFWVIPAILLIYFSYLLRAVRWWVMLSWQGLQVNFWLATRSMFIGNALNNILPLRGGDIYRIVTFSEKSNLSTGSILTCAAIERILDLASVSIFLCVGVVMSTESLGLDKAFDNMLSGVYVFLAAAFGSFLLVGTKPKYVQRFLHCLNIRLPFLQRTTNFLLTMVDALITVATVTNLMKLLLISLTAWLMEACAYLAIQKVFLIQLPLSALFAVAAVATLSTLLPSSPGYVGTYHYFLALAVMSYGPTKDLSAAYSIVMHFTLWASVCFLGLGAYIYERLGLKDGNQ